MSHKTQKNSHAPSRLKLTVLACLGLVLAVTAGSSAALAHSGHGAGQRGAEQASVTHRSPVDAADAHTLVNKNSSLGKQATTDQQRAKWKKCVQRLTRYAKTDRPGVTRGVVRWVHGHCHAITGTLPKPADPTPTPTTPPVTEPTPTDPTPTTPPVTTPTTLGGGTNVSDKGCASKPSACGFPDASNTGVPAGVVLKKSGSVNASKDGQVIDGLDITGEINVTAKNVTIKNTRVTGGRGVGPADWVVIVRPGADNLTIENSEIMTPVGSAQDIACVFNIGESKPTIKGTNIHGCSAGVSSGGGLVEDSYIHDMASIPGLSHDVGIASNGSGGMTVRHNTIFNQYQQTATVAFYQDFGTQKNNLVENNLLAGGGYCVYGGSGQKGKTSNIRFIDNRFSKKYSPNCGYYGVVASFTLSDPGNAWTGNFWDEDLKPIAR